MPVVLAAVLSGCAIEPSPDELQGDQLVGAYVDTWFVGDAARICRHDADPGFSPGLPACDEWLSISGISPRELRAGLVARGSVVRTREGVEIVPGHLVGTISGRSFAPASLDPEPSALPSATPVAEPAPSFATDEEKDAYVGAQPFPQPEGCTAPAVGWSSMSVIGLGPLDEYRRAHPDAVLGVAQTVVADGTTIALVSVAADADAGMVASELAGAYPDALCVQRSRLTADDVERVRDDPVLTASETVLVSTLDRPSETRGDDPEPVLTVLVTHLTDELVDRAAEYPDGLVEFDPWFEPVG